jgi:tRNA nucleotidyltransferase/poly(A) polymerase
MWIVGGWVRDRLLGGVSCDIDVALSGMTGKAFGDALTSYLEANDDRYRNRAEQLGIPYTRSSSFNSTSADEAKSRSLQTAVGMLFGLDIDLVNLRKEVYYDESSRTPSMQFGTAKEDASRRDATVNTLFYNLESQKVEDFAGTGLADLLVNRIIRTPLNPRQTFLDDPLRVLRLVRMSSKLGYPVEDDTFRWMENEEIHIEMDHKVKRERFGIEIGKMVASSHPERGLGLILRANLYKTIFIGRTSKLCSILRARFPDVDQRGNIWPTTWSRAINLLVALLYGADDLGEFVQTKIPVIDMWYLAIYSPIAALRHDYIRQAVQDATNSIKLTRRLSELLEICLRKYGQYKC